MTQLELPDVVTAVDIDSVITDPDLTSTVAAVFANTNLNSASDIAALFIILDAASDEQACRNRERRAV